MKRTLCLLAAFLLFLLPGLSGAEGVILLPEEVMANPWYLDDNAVLKTGNPTPLTGRFFTTMWGGTTSDLDVQDLLHAYSPVIWDGELGRFRFDRSVVQDAAAMNDENGNRTYLLVLADDLYWSDGSRITAGDYAFSCLLQMSPAVAETGGRPADYSWIAGCEEYLNGEAATVSGLRIIADNILQITMKAGSLPYFYELYRLRILPYPAGEIAPGTEAADDGEGAYLTVPLTADMLREYVLDERIGYLSHPRVVSGPYVAASFDGKTATFAINPYYKGNEAGVVPRIGKIEYSTAENSSMIDRLEVGRFDLLNKVTMADPISAGMELVRTRDAFAMENETRTGLTMLWFTETGAKVQDEAVRKAVAYCFDRDGFTESYAGTFGLRTDGFYGMGQWMYRVASGQAKLPAGSDGNAQEGEEARAINLDGLTRYELNTGEAERLLDEAGWNLNENGEPFNRDRDQLRYRQDGGELTGLILNLVMPESTEARAAIEDSLASNLRKAGIALRVKTADMETLQEIYRGGNAGDADMIYLGENFSVAFDPEILAPKTEGTALSAVKEELYALALDMVRTEPEDLAGFERKWIRLQERITETLPLIPVYSNIYFDFYNRKLHNYNITKALTWGEAIVSAYMSDREDTAEEADP